MNICKTIEVIFRVFIRLANIAYKKEKKNNKSNINDKGE